MDLNVGLVVSAVAAAVPDREAVVWRGGRRTYAAFLDRCRRLAAVLAAAGLGAHADPAAVRPHESAQDLLLLYLTNCPEYLEGMVGGYLARVGPANVNYRYTAAELRYLLDDSGARAAKALAIASTSAPPPNGFSTMATTSGRSAARRFSGPLKRPV